MLAGWPHSLPDRSGFGACHLINLTIQLTHRVASTASGERRTSPEEGPYAVLPQESRSECGGAGPRRLQFGVRERDASLSLLSENADNL